MAEKQVRTLHGWNVTGRLYDSEFPEQLDSLMVEAKMSYRNQSNGDILIYAGWTPEYDPNGEYVISVLRGCEYERPSIFKSDIEAAEKAIVALMRAYSEDRVTEDVYPVIKNKEKSE